MRTFAVVVDDVPPQDALEMSPPCDEQVVETVLAHRADPTLRLPERAQSGEGTAGGTSPDVVDTEVGQVYDSPWEGRTKLSWGREPTSDASTRATPKRYVPGITEELVKMMVSASGGKIRLAAADPSRRDS
jgi:hypothetical protein